MIAMLKRIAWYILIAGGMILLIILFRLYVSAPFVEEEITDISSIQAKQLDMYTEMIKLLITLSTALFGAIGGMFAHFYEKKTTPPSQIHLALLGATLSGGSILCGYFSYQRVVWMLQVKVFNLSQPHISWTSQLQFLLFLTSAMIAALFGYRATEENAR
jgi:hypothetical protein